MGSGPGLALAFAAVLAGGLLASSGLRNRSLSEVIAGITSPNVAKASANPEPASPEPTATSSKHLVKLSGSSPAAAIRSFFEQQGLTRAQAAGIVGNLQQESSLNPNAAGGGLDQGQGSRAHGGTMLQQLEAIWAELTGSESATLRALRRTRTPQAAARVFSQRFERPGLPMLKNREKYAQEAYNA